MPMINSCLNLIKNSETNWAGEVVDLSCRGKAAAAAKAVCTIHMQYSYAKGHSCTNQRFLACVLAHCVVIQ